MPGWVTNGLPAIGALVQNGTTQTAPAGQYSNLTSGALVAVDTETSSGQTPQSVAATAFQIACYAMEMINNTATSTTHAATLATTGGMLVTESLSTAAGSTYTFTLTNSLLSTAVAAPQVQVRSGTNTVGPLRVASVANGSGNSVFLIVNDGTAALNGTILIGFHL